MSAQNSLLIFITNTHKSQRHLILNLNARGVRVRPLHNVRNLGSELLGVVLADDVARHELHDVVVGLLVDPVVLSESRDLHTEVVEVARALLVEHLGPQRVAAGREHLAGDLVILPVN